MPRTLAHGLSGTGHDRPRASGAHSHLSSRRGWGGNRTSLSERARTLDENFVSHKKSLSPNLFETYPLIYRKGTCTGPPSCDLHSNLFHFSPGEAGGGPPQPTLRVSGRLRTLAQGCLACLALGTTERLPPLRPHVSGKRLPRTLAQGWWLVWHRAVSLPKGHLPTGDGGVTEPVSQSEPGLWMRILCLTKNL